MMTFRNFVRATVTDDNLIRFCSVDKSKAPYWCLSRKDIADSLNCAVRDVVFPSSIEIGTDEYGEPFGHRLVDDDGDLDLSLEYTIEEAQKAIDAIDAMLTDLQTQQIRAKRLQWCETFNNSAE